MKTNENTKELIAIVVSFTTHCQHWLTFHVDRARVLGIGNDDMNEFTAVGRMIQKGAISAMNKFAESVLIGSENKLSACCGSVANNCCR